MVISRESLENALERRESWRSLRNWMFLNLEWPAMGPGARLWWEGAGFLTPRARSRHLDHETFR